VEEMVLVPSIVDMPMDFTVIATSPTEMERAQKSMILWAARKIQAIKTEIAEAKEQFAQCVAHKWATTAWRAQITKHERHAEFYRKIKAALEAGYYIVPPFPIDVFAIRTADYLPKRMESRHHDNHDQRAQVLPIGEGRYVDPKPHRSSCQRPVQQTDGTFKNAAYYYADEFKDVGFPFRLAKAEIRAATDKALKLGVFDEVGVLPRVRAADPVVCGRIIDPTKPQSNRDRKAVTFFVAWWLDTKDI